jgi:hypothetical protein
MNFEQLNKLWEFPVDNSFANSLFSDQQISETPFQSSNVAQLCGKCQKMDFWEPRFRIKDTLSELAAQSGSCDFCKMRWDFCRKLNREELSSIQFDRLESMLRMNERYPPALSICRSPGMNILQCQTVTLSGFVDIYRPNRPENTDSNASNTSWPS